MSKVYKALSSEVFNIYLKENSAHLTKEAALPSKEVLEFALSALKFGGKALESVLPAGLKADDFIVGAIKLDLVSPEEIAALTGRNLDDIKKLLKASSDQAGDAASAAVAGSKLTQDGIRLSSEARSVISEISLNAQSLINSMKKLDSLDGKSAEEIAEIYREITSGKEALRKQILKAQEISENFEKLSIKPSKELKDLLLRAERAEEILKHVKTKEDMLKETISELGGKLDESGNLVAKLTEDLSSSKRRIDGLIEQGIELTAKHEKELAKAVEAAKEEGYRRAIADAARKSGAVDDVTVGLAEEAATNASQSAAKRKSVVEFSAPKASKQIDEAVKKAKKEGAEVARKEVLKAPKGKSAKNSFFQELVLKNSSKLISGAGFMAAKTFGLGASLAVGTLKFVTFSALFAVSIGGVGAAILWLNWASDNEEELFDAIRKMEASHNESLSSLKALKFKSNSYGGNKTKELILSIERSLGGLERLRGNLTSETLLDAAEKLDDLGLLLVEYVDDQSEIYKDLDDVTGFEGAIANLRDLYGSISEFKELSYAAINSGENSTGGDRGVESSTGFSSRKRDESMEGSAEGDLPGHVPHIISILGEEIDIGHLSRGMRSAAPRIIKKVLSSPEGLAFVDPENIWGGWLPKTPVRDADGKIVQDKQADYLRALKYLYLQKIFSRRSLRRFIRQNLQSAGRKRMSGWKEALKAYRKGAAKYASLGNNVFFTQKFKKPANSNGSSVISNKWMTIGMQKNADQISKEYFQDAVSGLEDQYAESYYSGLKSMYEVKPGKTEADFVKLYEVHNESGADLIGIAHPKSIEIADAMGNGGVVENQVEQHRHNTGVAKSMPSGNFLGRHAWVIKNLIKLANKAEHDGLFEVSNVIDETLEELSSI